MSDNDAVEVDERETLPPDPHEQDTSYQRRVLVTIGLVVGVLLLLILLWLSIDIILLIFIGILVSILLRGLARPLRQTVKLPERVALIVVILLLVVAFGGMVLILGPEIAEQGQQLIDTLPDTIREVDSDLRSGGITAQLLSGVPSVENLDDIVLADANLLEGVRGAFSSTAGFLGAFAVVAFIGIYFAMEPDLYVSNLIRLVPPARRDRINEVVQEIGSTLRWWLFGRFLSMMVIGVFTIIGLSLLKVPLALSLGVLAALLTFIPAIGPILSAIPAVLLALAQHPPKAIWVIVVLWFIQFLESYLITPFIDRRTIEIPPAVTILTQLLLGVLLGFPGLIVAAPMVAVILVLIRRLYLEDMLGETLDRQGRLRAVRAQSPRRAARKQQQKKGESLDPPSEEVPSPSR